MANAKPKMSRKKKLMAVGTTVTAIALVASSSFAWFTTSTSAKNRLQTADFNPAIVEDFTPPTEWKPGETVNKDASITNMGTGDALVRVRLEEVLRLLEDNGQTGRELDLKIYEAGKANNFDNAEAGGNNIALGNQMPVYVQAEALANQVKGDQANWKNITNDIDTANGNTALATAGITVLQHTTTDEAGKASYQFMAFKQVDPNTYLYEDDKAIVDDASTAIDDSTYGALGITLNNEAIAYQNVRVNMDAVTATTDLIQMYKELDFMVQTYNKQAEQANAHDFNNSDAIQTAHQYLNVLFGADVVDWESLVTEAGGTASSVTLDKIQNKWVYDADSKCFYWGGILGSGESTEQLLDALELDKTADNTYKNMRYNLSVVLDAIQNNAEQMQDQWGVEVSKGTVINPGTADEVTLSEAIAPMNSDLMNLLATLDGMVGEITTPAPGV